MMHRQRNKLSLGDMKKTNKWLTFRILSFFQEITDEWRWHEFFFRYKINRIFIMDLLNKKLKSLLDLKCFSTNKTIISRNLLNYLPISSTLKLTYRCNSNEFLNVLQEISWKNKELLHFSRAFTFFAVVQTEYIDLNQNL